MPSARAPLFAFVCASMVLAFSGCGATDAINEAIKEIESTQATIQQESSSWRNELPQLQADLDLLVEKQQAKGTADVKQILADTSNDVASLTQDTIKVAGLTAEEAAAKFGTEARCNVDFARSRVSASLSTLVRRLKFWQKNGHAPPPPPHSVCQVTPDTVELRSTGADGGWSMEVPRDKIVGVYGYDFRRDAVPRAELDDSNGNKRRDTTVSVAYVTRYQLNLNFGPEDYSQIAPGDRFVLQWADEPEPNGISVTLIRPARLKILGVELQPPTARAKADLVRPVVDVINQGGSETGQFTVVWTPGPNDPVQSQSVNNLGAGERRSVTFPGYVYKAAGTFQNDVVVGSGSDSWHGSITVTPYANTARTQNVGIRGEWPNGGGNPGETRDNWGLPTIALGPGCELDTSRGSGSFEVSDINNDNIKYLISWPAGFDFGFGENTIWRSFHSLAASYDVQANRATPTVTLKGLGGHGIFPTRGPERFNGTFTVYSMCPQ